MNKTEREILLFFGVSKTIKVQKVQNREILYLISNAMKQTVINTGSWTFADQANLNSAIRLILISIKLSNKYQFKKH